jgi:hypothetical protein
MWKLPNYLEANEDHLRSSKVGMEAHGVDAISVCRYGADSPMPLMACFADIQFPEIVVTREVTSEGPFCDEGHKC